ncbi:MAG: MFS transporter [Acidimicrobiales bacterium]|nr:MFS transporter [Acidimicrobiales bacterium]
MELLAPPQPDPRPWPERFRFAVAHPIQWLQGITGGASVYPLLILFGLNAVDELDRTAFGVLLPDIQDHFGLDLSGILTVVAVVLGISLLLQVPIAHYADRTNRVRLALIGACAWAFFSFTTGLAVAVWMLYVTRTGSGLGKAVNDPTHNSLLADYYPVQQRARVYSFHRAANAIGQFLGPLLGGLLAYYFTWRTPFFVFAVPTVILVVLGLRLREPVRGAQERRAMGATEDVIGLEEPPPSFEEAWRMIQKVRTLRRIFAALPFLAAAMVGFVSLAALKYEALGLNAAERGLAASIAEPFQLLGLYLGARWGTRRLMSDPGGVIKLVAKVSVVAACLAAVFALSPNIYVAVVANICISITLAIILPSVLASLSLAIPARARSVGFSIGSLYVLPGLFVLPMVGALGDLFGINWGMLLMTPVFLLGGFIIASAGDLIKNDIRNVWTATAARSELIYDRRQGKIKQLLVRGLDVKYGDVQILFNVDFEVDEGEVIALLGTNGAGKSTLLKAICGVVGASNGAIIFDGRDITHAPPHEIAALGIAMVPGGQGVFPTLTVAENLRVATWLDRKRGVDVESRVNEVLGMFPVLGQRLDEPAANLSGGQQQMLALGMAFLSRPKLLAIDELSLGLAPVVVEQLLPIVRRITEGGTTVILVEQSVNVALTIAETAVFMEKGEIRFRGPTADLLHRPDVLRSVFLEGASKGMSTQGAQGETTESEPGPGIATETQSRHATLVGSGTSGNGSKPLFEFPDDADSKSGVVVASRSDQSNVEEPASVNGAALEVVELSVRFGGIKAVDSVSFSLAPGEILGIIGPNGAGKTTLFDLISGFTASDEGRVILHGRDITALTPDGRARAGLGRSFQDARLFPALTVEETIATALERWVDVRDPLNAAFRLPAYIDTEDSVQYQVDALIELMGIEAFRTKFVRELSTGSRRVVDLACVLAHHPSVVLLDEPSSGIAQKEAEALGPLIKRIRENLDASIIVIEHDMPLISSVSDRLLALDQGRVVTSGSPRGVLNHPAVVASYLGNTEEVIARSGTRGSD